MKKIISGFVAVIGLASLGNIVHADSTVEPFAKVHAGHYQVDPNHTQVLFSVNHFGFTNYTGTLSDVKGSLNLLPKQLSKSHVHIQLPIQTVKTTSTILDGELKDKEWFDATTYPSADFVSTEIVKTGEKTADVTGNLTLHGITKPVTLHVTYIGAGVNPMNKKYTVGFQMNGVIHRSEFGIAKYVPAVSDAVKLEIAGAFEQDK